MDPFELLTRGVLLNRGEKSRAVFFRSKQEVNAKEPGVSIERQGQGAREVLNFFGESTRVSKRRRISEESSRLAKNLTARCQNPVNTNQETWLKSHGGSAPGPSIVDTHDEEDSRSPQESHSLKIPCSAPLDSGVVGCFQSLSEVKRYRARNNIFIYATLSLRKKRGAAARAKLVPAPLRSFDDLSRFDVVPHWLIRNVRDTMKFVVPTPIQMQAIPCILTGEPLVASAPTGCGKTLAFLLPLVALMKAPSKEFLRSLILVPTRELAVQTVREFDILIGHKKFRCRILEHHSSKRQSLKRLDLGVSTPLRLVHLLREGQVNLNSTKHVVLDEADRLFDMGFSPQIDEILSNMSLANVQLLLFSATLPPRVMSLVESVLLGATRISIGGPLMVPSEIEQRMIFVSHERDKLGVLRQLINVGDLAPPILIFVQTIECAKTLFKELVFDGIYVDVTHSDRPKLERDRVVQAFREKKIWVLIATDLMARGVDFYGVQVVVNWNLPPTVEAYIHRIGRTGRAGSKGKAITFYTTAEIKRVKKYQAALSSGSSSSSDIITGPS